MNPRSCAMKTFLLLLTSAFMIVMTACGSGKGHGGKDSGDIPPPTVKITSNIASPTNLTSIPVTVTFNEPVNDFDENDITIVNGAISGFTDADTLNGSVYTFNITSPIKTITVDIAADVCKDDAGNGNKAAATFSIKYHDHKPVAAISSTVVGPTQLSRVPVTITFDEAVTGFTQDDIIIANGTMTSFIETIPNTTYTFDVINPVGPVSAITVEIAADTAFDSAGNGNKKAAQFVRIYDIQKPVPAISSTVVGPTNVSTIPVDITFSEAVNDFTSEDISIANGAVSDFSGSGAHYSFNITSPSTTVNVDINADVCTDDAGNFNTASSHFSIVYDPIKPGVTMSSETASPTNLTSIPVIITFAKTVTGFTSADIIISNGRVSDFTGEGALYSFNITSPSGLVTVDIPADAAFDASGNGNTSARQFSITFDDVRPTITSITSSTANGFYRSGSVINITVNFSEPVTLAGGDLIATLDTGDAITMGAISNAAKASAIYTVGGNDTSADLTAVSIKLTAGTIRDAAHNDMKVSLPADNIAALKDIVIDTQAPTIRSIVSKTPDGAYTIGANVDITVNFSEPVTLAGGSLNVTLDTTDVISITAISSASSASATYTVSPGDSSADLESTAIALSAGTLMDAADNKASVALPVGQTLAALKNIVVDGIALTITQARTMDSNGNGKIGNYKITFNRNVNDSTFPGYIANSTGNAQSDWLVAGYNNVRMAHGTAAPETDIVNDNIIYIKFDESALLDTDAKPDLTTTTTPRLKDLNGNSLTQVITAAAAESDGAKPIITSASGVTGSAILSVNFSEPVDSDGSTGGGCNSAIQISDLTYSNVNGSGAASISSMGSDTNGCDDSKISITLNTALTPGDINADKLAAPAGAIFDPSNNTASTALVFVTGSIAPYVLGVTATEVRKIRITYSEPVNISQATTLTNYTLVEDPVQSPCGGSGSDVVALTGSVSWISDDVYELSTNADQCSTTTYRLTVSANVTDQNENAALINPIFGTFLGNERLKLTSASCLTTKTLIVIFNKPVKSGTGTGGAELISRYKLTGSSNLGSLSTAVRGTNSNTNKVTLTHAINQTGGAYTVIGSNATNGDGFDDSALGAIEFASAVETLQNNPNDRAPWSGCGTAIDQFDQGPIASDPFGDSSDFGFLAAYNNQLYIGPNAKGNSANRMNPDGSNPINLLFEFEKDTNDSGDGTHDNSATTRDGSITVPPFVTLGWSGCTANNAGRNTGCGPDNENGRGLFNVGTLNNTSILFIGGSRPYDRTGLAHFDYIYYTTDTDTSLNFRYIDMGDISGTATAGLQSIATLDSRIWAGMAKVNSNINNAPDFGKISFNTSDSSKCVTELNCDATDGTNGKRAYINFMDYFGGNGPMSSKRNYAYYVGVDSIFVFNSRLYLANGGHNRASRDGAIIRSTSADPDGCTYNNLSGSGSCSSADWTEITPRTNAAWYNSNTRFSVELPATYDLIPADRAFAQFAEFNGNLYVTRTACHTTPGTDAYDTAEHVIPGCNNGSDTDGYPSPAVYREAQLWKCTPGTTGGVSDCDAGDWTLIDGNADGLTNFGHTGNRSLTMLVKNGSRLYVGFDNKNGIEIWRTKASVTNPASESDFEQIGTSGLGNPASMKQIYSGISIQQGVDYYIYISVGLAGNPVAVYRNKNN